MKVVISARAAACVLSLFTFGLSVATAQVTNTCVSPINGNVYSKFALIELAEYTQTNAVGAFPADTNSFAFEAIISLATNKTASAATVTLPDGAVQPMRMTEDSIFGFVVVTNSFSNLVSAFPDGEYVFTISNNTTSVTLPYGTTIPNAPTLANYTAAQAIDATQDFTLSWGPFSGGRRQDYISVKLTDQYGNTVFKSGDYGCPDSLDGMATSVLLPANTLATNQTYSTEIDFLQILTLDTNSIPGDALLAGTESDTLSTITTGPEQASAAVLTNAALLPGGGIRFDLATTPGVSYTVQFNGNLSNPFGWTSLLTSNAAGTLISFTNTPPVGTNAGFYRAVQN